MTPEELRKIAEEKNEKDAFNNYVVLHEYVIKEIEIAAKKGQNTYSISLEVLSVKCDGCGGIKLLIEDLTKAGFKAEKDHRMISCYGNYDYEYEDFLVVSWNK